MPASTTQVIPCLGCAFEGFTDGHPGLDFIFVARTRASSARECGEGDAKELAEYERTSRGNRCR